MRAIALSLLTCAGILFSASLAKADDAISKPASKTIGAAKTDIVPSLIVLNSKGATLEGDKLTLTGISPNSIIFADRPVRFAGHALTAHLLFIDIIGLPFTPLSFAGVARRSARRAAFYGMAAAPYADPYYGGYARPYLGRRPAVTIPIRLATD
jgi:hypothetical protein